MDRVGIRLGDRVVYVSPEVAARARAKQAELQRRSKQLSHELRQARLSPGTHRNATYKVTGSNHSVPLSDGGTDNYQSWQKSKREHLHREFNRICLKA